MTALVSSLKGFFSGDTLFIFVAFAVFCAYAMFMGRGRIVSLILSFYPALLVFNTFPFVNKFLVLHGDTLITLNKVGVFLLFLIPISIIVNRFVVSFSEHTGAAHFVRIIAFSLIGVALVLIFSYSVVSLDALHNFSPAIDKLFTGMDRIFYWNIGILVLLAFL